MEVIRELTEADLDAAWKIVQQLRPHLDRAEFGARSARQAAAYGYVLAGLFDDGVLVAVTGFRPLETLARGRCYHVDDLVVDAARRGAGHGRNLLAWVQDRARAEGRGGVFLNARQQAIPFYESMGYGFHPAPEMYLKTAS